MIRYKHRNCNKEFIPATFCYDLPPASLFEKMFSEAQTVVNFPFGMTILHKKEKNYCKATGRFHSFKNMKITRFELQSIRFENKKQKFILKTTIDNKTLILQVSTDLVNSTNSFLNWVDFEEFFNYYDI